MTTSIVSCPACGTRNRVPAAAGGTPVCAGCKAPLPWTVEARRDDVDAALVATVPVVVDLWAPWCAPCRTVTPILEQAARDRAGRLKVVKVNVDELPDISVRYGVRGIPTLLLLDRGVEVARQVGALPATAFDRWLDSYVAGDA